MTAALLFVPLSSPGASAPRQARGADSSDAAGLFALLLAGVQPAEARVEAGAQPVQANIMAGAQRPALASLPADAVVPQTATAAAMPMPARPDLAASRPARAARLPAEAALPLTTLPAAAPAQAGLGQDNPLPRLGPPTQALQSPAPDGAEGAERTRTAAAPHPVLHHRLDAVVRAPGEAAAPPRPAITAEQPLPMRPSEAAPIPHAATRREAPVAFIAAQVPIAAEISSPQSTAPRRIAGAPAPIPRVSSPANAVHGAMATPSSGLERANVSTFATVLPSPGPAADRPAVTDQVGTEPAFEAFESALGRSEQSAPDPIRPPAPGRTAPPAPIFQIGVQIAKAVPAGVDRLFVQLEPAALGRVEIRLEFHRDNQVSAMIAAERPDTLDALQRDARLLERSLQDAGLRLDSDGLTFSLKREQAQDQAREHAPFALPADDASNQPPLTTHDDEPPPLHWFHGLRTLDIRI